MSRKTPLCNAIDKPHGCLLAFQDAVAGGSLSGKERSGNRELTSPWAG